MIDKIKSGIEPLSANAETHKPVKAKEAKPAALPKDQVSLSKGSKSEPAAPKKWTVLFYFDGNNNLAPMAGHSLTSLKKVGSDENVNLVAQFSVPETSAERGLINKQESGKKLSKKDETRYIPGSEKLGIKDMGDPATLKEFIKWGMKNYPAEHYAVVPWDHGAGFMGAMTDDKSNHIIDNAEMATLMKDVAKETGKKIDVLNYNACVMGQAEVAYELRDAAKYMVGSEEVEAGLTIPIPGIYGTTPQHKVMTDLKNGIKEKGDVTPEELSKLYVFESEKQFGATMFTATQSAIDLSKMDAVKDGADKLAGLLLDKIKADPKMVDTIRKDVGKTQHFLLFDQFAEPYKDFRDLGHFAKVIGKNPAYGKEVAQACKELRESVKTAVIAEQHALESNKGHVMEHSTGLSAYIPKDYGYDLPRKNPIDNIPSSGTRGYENLEFSKKTKWDELLTAISKNDDFLGKHPNIRNAVEKALPMIEMEGYQKSYEILSGATKPAWSIIPTGAKIPFLPIPGPVAAAGGILGGVTRAVKGAKKFITGVVEDFKPKSKAKLAVNGALDVSIGIGSIAACGALLAGATTIAFPAAVAVMALGVGRTAVSLISGYMKSHNADKMTVQEKLVAMDKEMETKQA